nr:RsmF rRNA methyltransferase first C-terminal domain-containing protein [Lachnospiraceae bacterium]
MKNLPTTFTNKMKELLTAADYNQFLQDSTKPPFRGIRVNTLKCTAHKIKQNMNFVGEKTPFCDEGFYIPFETANIGDEPFHHAGAFYVQEPSASSAAAVLDVKSGDKVLDLCAAPGGKSTQLGAKLNGTGLLWSNEIVKNRANILLSNIERMGIPNAVVSSCHPDILCTALEGFFDKILVDAPCSGEGMFRKDNTAVAEWTPQHSIACGERQFSILSSAAKALKYGGEIVYSTCTFSVEENEKVISRFLSENSDFEQVEIDVNFGRKAENGAVRILPSDGGEGHFVAKLRKKGELISDFSPSRSGTEKFPELNAAFDLYDELFTERIFGECFKKIGDKILLLPNAALPSLNGLGVLRAGILFGEIKKNRIEPCHSLFMAASKENLRSCVDFSYDDNRLRSFYHGEEIMLDCAAKG